MGVLGFGPAEDVGVGALLGLQAGLGGQRFLAAFGVGLEVQLGVVDGLVGFADLALGGGVEEYAFAFRVFETERTKKGYV